ncbi:MAG: CoA transferase, partial [Anaerolineae bacterium]
HWMADFSQPDDFAGGVMHPYEAPETGYRCKDRPITFGFLGRRTEKRDPWQDLCKALGLEELLEDSWMVEHGAGYVGVGRDAQEMKPLLENVIATRTSDEVLEIVHEIGGAGMPFMAYDELYGRPLHPQVEATEAIVEIRDPDGGSQRAILSPWAVGGSLGRRDHTVAPDLGADTDQILRGLGFDDDETGQLRKAGRIR